ncbi:MAG: hypothetical protein HFF52_05715 [Lawsonibacter sp.]|nr:hypothetical protein [Lawsonibacter sp.]
MLRGKEIKERLRRGEVVTSIMLRFPDANLAEMLAIQGVDLIIIDNEHYPFDPETMIQVIRASHAGGACCMVRLPNAEPARIAQVMDMGADGIQIPSVDSYEEALQLRNAVKFAPVGTRGFCPITRAAAYGHGMTPVEFARISNENTFVVPQIETREGVEDIDRILSIPEVDWVPIGPSDLSASYGCPGEYSNPQVVNAIKAVQEKSAALGRSGGVMCHSPQAMAEARELGTTFLSLGSDQQILMNGLKQLVGAVRDWQSNQK